VSDCPCVCHRPDVIEEDLRRQLAEEDAAVLRRIREASYDVAAAADWAAVASRPTHAELTERRNRWGYSDPAMEAWRQAAARRFEQRRSGGAAS